ncbi:uncharacterized protein LOC114733838 [Neltuma alba]|uniref:uncharacterized protein LOC114733838 n=1 Tax=Neltuma alba TaxID=207710 RepID=UPI0010A4CF66|nr:uncharacterized protein LOC114733838 [Prosopis alba]
MNKSFMIWNCQGAGSAKFQRTLGSLLQGYKPNVVALVEPRISGKKADLAIKKTGYPNSHRIEAEGFSGGIWLLWRDCVTVDVLQNHHQFIHTRVSSEPGTPPILFTAVYGSPRPIPRENLWRQLLQIAEGVHSPWILAGDFNATISMNERRGGSRHAQAGCKSFKQFISKSGLIDLGYVGPKFTWQRGNLMVRLDRALSNGLWIQAQPNTQVLHLPKIHSDHRPVLIKQVNMGQQTKRPFRYLASWASHEGFHSLVSNTWRNEQSLAKNIESFTKVAHAWNIEVYGSIGKRKADLRRRITGVQKALERQPFSW